MSGKAFQADYLFKQATMLMNRFFFMMTLQANDAYDRQHEGRLGR